MTHVITTADPEALGLAGAASGLFLAVVKRRSSYHARITLQAPPGGARRAVKLTLVLWSERPETIRRRHTLSWLLLTLQTPPRSATSVGWTTWQWRGRVVDQDLVASPLGRGNRRPTPSARMT